MPPKAPPINRERAVIGTLLEVFPAKVPTAIAKLLEHAPESFDDAACGRLAVLMRDLSRAGTPVSATRVSVECSTRNIVIGESTALFIMGAVAEVLPLELAELEAVEIWKQYQTRRSKTVLQEATVALDENPAQANFIVGTATRALESLKTESAANNGHGLPEIVECGSFIQADLPAPKELICGLLHKGCKMSLGGSSKAYKSWSFIDIALSVAHGIPWLDFDTNPGKVLYINFENPTWACRQRIEAVAQARQLQISANRLYVWNLRGHATTFDQLLPKIIGRIGSEHFDLVILDPIYKIYGATDENSATDVAQLLNAIETIATQTGAAVVYGAHFSKGNQAAKEAIDRVSGSGVFARDPDTIITFTSHEEEAAFTVEIVLRNHSPVQPFVVRWAYPTFATDKNLNPENLKEISGRPKTYNPQIILELLDQPRTTSEWQKLAAQEKGITRATFFRMLDQATNENLISKSKISNKWMPVVS